MEPVEVTFLAVPDHGYAPGIKSPVQFGKIYFQYFSLSIRGIFYASNCGYVKPPVPQPSMYIGDIVIIGKLF